MADVYVKRSIVACYFCISVTGNVTSIGPVIMLLLAVLLQGLITFAALRATLSLTLNARKCSSKSVVLEEEFVGAFVIKVDADEPALQLSGVEDFSMKHCLGHSISCANFATSCTASFHAFKCSEGDCSDLDCLSKTDDQLRITNSITHDSEGNPIVYEGIILNMNGFCADVAGVVTPVATNSPIIFAIEHLSTDHNREIRFRWSLLIKDSSGKNRTVAVEENYPEGTPVDGDGIMSSNVTWNVTTTAGRYVSLHKVHIHKAWTNFTSLELNMRSIYNGTVLNLISTMDLDVSNCTYDLLKTNSSHMNANCTFPAYAGYGGMAPCNCVTGFVLPHLNDSKFHMRCEKNTQWIPVDGKACWYEPVVTIAINQIYIEGENISAVCDVTPGYPGEHNVSMFIGGREYLVEPGVVVNDIQAGSSLDGAEVFCLASNAYTLKKKMPARSNTEEIAVLYGPVNTSGNPDCLQVNGESYDVNITLWFQSNADIIVVNASSRDVHMENISHSALSYTYKAWLRGVDEQYSVTFTAYYRLNMSQNPVHSRLVYTFDGDDCHESTTTKMPETSELSHSSVTIEVTSSPTKLTDWAIATIAGAGALLLILVIILLIVIVKKRNASDKKKEVINPIYDTTSMSRVGQTSSDGKSKDSEKVERENPLYGTAGDVTYAPIKKKKKPKKDSVAEQQEATGNETYATVDKGRKKEKKKGSGNGQSNDAFSGEADATYAAVNKKKKRSDKSEDEPSTSGLGNNAQVSEDCTYAAVQKKGKKKPKDDDEDLHGSSK